MLLVALTVPTLLATLLAVPNVAVGETRVPFVSTSSTTSCGQWNVQGTWTSAATNGYHVTFRFAQSGTSITGTATNPRAEATIAGYASGTLVGNHWATYASVTVPRSEFATQIAAPQTYATCDSTSATRFITSSDPLELPRNVPDVGATSW